MSGDPPSAPEYPYPGPGNVPDASSAREFQTRTNAPHSDHDLHNDNSHYKDSINDSFQVPLLRRDRKPRRGGLGCDSASIWGDHGGDADAGGLDILI